jgi:hypothetical protein
MLMVHNKSARTSLINCSLLIGCLLQLQCGSTDFTAVADSNDGTTVVSPIVGGTSVATCNWPTAVRISPSGCTGTLIHPRVVITAAHCEVEAGSTVNFGEGQSAAFSVKTTSCKAGDGRGVKGDWAFCLLPEDSRLEKLPIIPPLHDCERKKFLKPGATVWGVGFGATGPDGNGYGKKRQVEMLVNKVGDGYVDVGEPEHGLCNGDSGGPLFIHLKSGGHDWGFRTVGSTSGLGVGSRCEGTTTFPTVEQHIKGIVAAKGPDVLPCTDASGKWAPGPDCVALPTAPERAGGTWPACNMGEKTSEVIDSCGEGVPGAGGMGGVSGGGAGGGAGTGGKGVGGKAGDGTGTGTGSGGTQNTTSGGSGGAVSTGGKNGAAGYGGQAPKPGTSGNGGRAGTDNDPGNNADRPKYEKDEAGFTCAFAGSGSQPGSRVVLASLILGLILLRRSLRIVS